MNISRRKFLGLSIVAGVVPLYAWYAWHWSDPADIIVAILKRRVGYLHVDPATFNVFAREYVMFKREYEKKLAVLSSASLLLQFFSPYRLLPQGHAFRRLEDNVVSTYLFSTDFFSNNANEQRPVSYIGFYDPYTRSCSNPFNRQP